MPRSRRILRHPVGERTRRRSSGIRLNDLRAVQASWRGAGSPESKLPIVWSCLTFISKRIRSVPVRALGADGSETALPRWVTDPYPGVTWPDVVSIAVWSLLHAGNWYLMPLRNRANVTVAVAYPHPDDITIDEYTWREHGELRYMYRGQPIESEFHHVRFFTRPGQALGLGALDAMRTAVDIGESSQDYINRHFQQGAQLQYILTSQAPLGEQSKLDVAAQIHASMLGPDNAWRPLIADGFDIKSIQMTTEQARFLELAQWTDQKIAGQIYHIDPTLLGIQTSGSSLTYTNAVDRESNLWRDCLDPIARLIEDALSMLANGPVTIDIDSSGALAGSIRDRIAVADQMASINQKAGMVVYDGNEIREVTGHVPRDELDFDAMMEEAERKRQEMQDALSSGDGDGDSEGGGGDDDSGGDDEDE